MHKEQLTTGSFEQFLGLPGAPALAIAYKLKSYITHDFRALTPSLPKPVPGSQLVEANENSGERKINRPPFPDSPPFFPCSPAARRTDPLTEGLEQAIPPPFQHYLNYKYLNFLRTLLSFFFQQSSLSPLTVNAEH